MKKNKKHRADCIKKKINYITSSMLSCIQLVRPWLLVC